MTITTTRKLAELARELVHFDRGTKNTDIRISGDKIRLWKQDGTVRAKAQWADAIWVVEKILEAGSRESEARVEKAKKILIDGLKYHEHDGHDMPKRVVREALAALGVDEEAQP